MEVCVTSHPSQPSTWPSLPLGTYLWEDRSRHHMYASLSKEARKLIFEEVRSVYVPDSGRSRFFQTAPACRLINLFIFDSLYRVGMVSCVLFFVFVLRQNFPV